MTKEKKMTKADYFRQIMTKYNLDEAETAFIEHELELLAKKNSSEKKPTATQVANDSLKEAILAGMEKDKFYTITELMKAIPECAELTNQKVSALVRQLTPDYIERIEDKRKTYFRLV